MKGTATAPPGGSPAAARADAPVSPTEAARASIRYLADHRLAPTPANYRRAWIEVGGPSHGADAEQVAQAALRLLGHRLGSSEPGLAALASTVREQRWDDALATLLELDRHAPCDRWGELLAAACEGVTVSGRDWPAARRLQAIAAAVQENAAGDTALRTHLEMLVLQWQMDPPTPSAPPVVAPAPPVGGAGTDGVGDPVTGPPEPAAEEPVSRRELARLRKVNAELSEIVVSLCDSFEAVADEGSWIVSQVDAVREAVRDGADRRSLAAARQLLQQALATQQSITRSRRDAVASLRDLLPHLVQQMAHLGRHASVFGDTLDEHLAAIAKADSLERIAERVRGLIADGSAVQQTFDAVRRDLGERQQRAEALEDEVERLERELAQASERLMTDHLTRTANRAGLERAFQRALDRLRSNGDPLAIALLDIDDFKKVNDALGHQAGDGALRHLAGLLLGKVREGDTVARYGGEEFVILLPGMTEEQARELLVRAQRELTREVYLHESRRIFITFSAGATRVQPLDSLESAIGRADDAMYQAKNAGKNCVAIA